MKTEIQVEIKDLAPAAGVELSSEELQAVSGGERMEETWSCGRLNKPDEWDIVP